jgi:hypothetical protein
VKAIGEVEDLAYAVTMLASPRADYINCANFHVGWRDFPKDWVAGGFTNFEAPEFLTVRLGGFVA